MTKIQISINDKKYITTIEDLLDDIITQNEESEIALAYHRNGCKIDECYFMNNEQKDDLIIELISTRSKLIDIIKAFGLACKYIEAMHDKKYSCECLKNFFLKEARCRR